MRTALVATLSALVIVAAPAAAHAGTRTFGDQKGDVSNTNDITSYTVTNGKRIVLTTHHRNLTKQAIDIQFFVKNSKDDKVFDAYASLNGKANYVGLVGSGDFAPCRGLTVGHDLAEDTATLSVPRRCLAYPVGKIKMRARVQWSVDGSKGDWAPNKGYSGWVSR